LFAIPKKKEKIEKKHTCLTFTEYKSPKNPIHPQNAQILSNKNKNPKMAAKKKALSSKELDWTQTATKVWKRC